MSLWPRRVRVRRLRAADAGQWRDLRLEALSRHPEAFGASHDDWAGRPLADFAERLEQGCVYGAFLGDVLIGSMALDVDGDSGEITAVYVQATHRGRGVARAILRALVKEAKGRGLSRLFLTVAVSNTAAMRFYQLAGFQPVQQAPRALTSDGRLLEALVMMRAV